MTPYYFIAMKSSKYFDGYVMCATKLIWGFSEISCKTAAQHQLKRKRRRGQHDMAGPSPWTDSKNIKKRKEQARRKEQEQRRLFSGRTIRGCSKCACSLSCCIRFLQSASSLVWL